MPQISTMARQVAQIDRKLAPLLTIAASLRPSSAGGWIRALRQALRHVLLGGTSYRCATPTRGAHAEDAAKRSGKMRLVCESACQCNMRQPLPRGCHHEFGALDSSCRDIRHGRGSKALFECSREMTRAQSHEIGHVAQPDLQSKMVLYVLDSPPGLPSRETTGPQNALRRRRNNANCFGFSAEECRGIPQAAPRDLAIRLKQCHGSRH
jgi:hypothetical protein